MILFIFCKGHALRGPLTKTVSRVMRITAFFILVCSLHLSATTSSQTVTIQDKNIALEAVFTAVEKQTGFSVVYNKKIIKNIPKVAVDAKQQELQTFFQHLLINQPLTYTIRDKTILIAYKPIETTKEVPRVIIDAPPVTGIVVAEGGQPLAGANIIVKGTMRGTVTSANGSFSIETNTGETLVISSIGYTSKEIIIQENKPVGTVELLLSQSKLDEVQIIAYGQTSRRLQTGNVSSVKASEIENQPVTNPLMALQGRVPGINIVQANGLPGSGVTVRIQGQNSITKGNDPFYVIDGVPYMSLMPPSIYGGPLGSSGDGPGGGSGNPLSYINPMDIESIEILKDADATAIYGSRAANGAILITTKKGKAGDTKFNINYYNGWGNVSSKMDLLNTSQYLEMRKETFANDGRLASADPTSPDYAPDLKIFDSTRYTDWQKKLLGNTAGFKHIDATISGGGSSTQYAIGATYHQQKTVFPTDYGNQKASVHLSINNTSANQKFKLQLSGNYLRDINELPVDDLTNVAILLAPNAPELYNSDGSLNWMPNSAGASTWLNPLAGFQKMFRLRTRNLVTNAVLSYKLAEGLEIKSSFGYTDFMSEEFSGIPLGSLRPERRPTSVRQSTFADGVNGSWIIEPQLTYKRNIGKGVFDFLIGTTVQQSNSSGDRLTASGFNSDQEIENIKAATDLNADFTFSSKYKYNAGFSRISYNLFDKYILNLNARRDGSSRFGSENLFHNFYSAGIAWIFSEEELINDNLPFLSFGKLRASYGTLGNDQIGDYTTLDLYTPYSVAIPYQQITGFEINGLANPYLQWEKTRKISVALELGFWSDRLFLSANYYNNRSSNQLLSLKLPIITGYGGITSNFPATVANWGWEIAANSVNIKTRSFQWSSNLNLTVPRNKLVSFQDFDNAETYGNLAVGRPLTNERLFRFAGVDPTTGAYQFYTRNGELTFEPNGSEDNIVFIDPAPRYYGGLSNNIRYKNFTLDFTFQFVKQIGRNYIFGNSGYLTPGYYVNSTGDGNQPVSVLNRWRKPGDEATVQRFNSNFAVQSQFGYANGSDAAYSDASFLRLKNLAFSWNVPDILKSKMNIKLYVQCQNLLTFTKFKGLDPETRSIALPTLRVITTGINVGF